jgi:hypothetical protein
MTCRGEDERNQDGGRVIAAGKHDCAPGDQRRALDIREAHQDLGRPTGGPP